MDFLDANMRLDEEKDLPKGLVSTLRSLSVGFVDLPYTDLFATIKDLEERAKNGISITKESNQKLVDALTEKQKKAKLQEELEKGLKYTNNSDYLSNDLFANLKTGEEKYKDFISIMKIKKSNIRDSLKKSQEKKAEEKKKDSEKVASNM